MTMRLESRVNALEQDKSHQAPIIVFGCTRAEAAQRVAELGKVDRPVISVCWRDPVTPEQERLQKTPLV